MPVVQQIEDYNDVLIEEKKYKPKLFTYPDSTASQTVFYEDDLEFDDFYVLCT